MATIEVDVDIESLAWELGRTLTDSALMDFIVEMDEQRELSFTKALVARLQQVIKENE